MKTIKFIAACALWISASASFGHENMPHHGAVAAAHREQTAWGIAGDETAVRRTVTVRMTDDMRFAPRHIEVHEGDTVRLRAENTGQVLHEIVLGTKAEIDQHAQTMARSPGMKHQAAHMVHVRPGERGDIVWRFNRPGSFAFACLIPGHYEAGMSGTITVLPHRR